MSQAENKNPTDNLFILEDIILKLEKIWDKKRAD